MSRMYGSADFGGPESVEEYDFDCIPPATG